MMQEQRTYNRLMLRSAFRSLFANVMIERKRQKGFTFKALADALGINKSYISRSFSTAPNWQIDKISDMADVLGVDIIVEARDRDTGVIYTASDVRQPPEIIQVDPAKNASSNIRPEKSAETGSVKAKTLEGAAPDRRQISMIVGTGAA